MMREKNKISNGKITEPLSYLSTKLNFAYLCRLFAKKVDKRVAYVTYLTLECVK